MVDSAWSSERWLRPLLADVIGQEPLAALAADGRPLWEAVVVAGLMSDEHLLRLCAERFATPVADLRAASPGARRLLDERWARKYRVLPLRAVDGALEVATADPLNLDCERAIAFATGRSVRFTLASPLSLERALDATYRDELRTPRPDVQHLTADVESAPPADAPDEDFATVSGLVDELLGEGIAARVSDIHIEPEERGIVVRHRVDGVLRTVRTLPRAVAPSLVSRLKILCGLDIADRLRPQDGRARVAVNGVAVDLRVSTLPASHGEKVAIRVLDARGAVLTLDGMGFLPDEQERIERLLEAREGLILVTGPTGSGKTTTLYAALRQLQRTGVNIVTVEDPIEYRLPGIVQVQVNERAGLTFAAALRSIMRQDPDVLLIGEIRDRETAEIAIQASLTGHLVFSTLHTNDAASAVTRLVDVGVAPYKIATAVKGVLAQRLVRRVCGCGSSATRREPDRPIAQTSNRPIAMMVAEPAPSACRECGGGGFRGRLAIVEILIATPDFERAVAAGESAERLAETARLAGMRSLWDSGVAHVTAGHTSQTELLRVATPPARVDGGGAASYLPVHHTPAAPMSESAPVSVQVATVDVYVIRPLPGGWKALLLRRATGTRCPGSWEAVHGRIDPGERPEQAAVREVREETGLEIARLFNVSVQPFYMQSLGVVTAAVVFAAFVDEPAAVRTSEEHEAFEWLAPDDAERRFVWPRSRVALREILALLDNPAFATIEDVVRMI
jgi:type II secretory ATPase GspE/PulE/Tfp pilus assembly ATPase PilB-like protein/8-oxo-dGTP pyrophosphatase MutT (NUDIX family)